MNGWALAAADLAALGALFGVGRILAARWENYGLVDILWSYAFAPVAAGCALVGRGWLPRRAVLALLVLVWSLRLGTHLLRRVRRLHPREDTRYARLRIEWGGRFAVRMTGFFQLQAASVIVLSLPFFLASNDSRPAWSGSDFIGIALWGLGVAIEALADRQLHRFQQRPENRGQVCGAGLWSWSRHPNYFGEWLIWLGYFALAAGAPWGMAAAISPACILYLLLRVTGIPMAEEQSLRSRGDAYRRYQARTSAFIPLPPRAAHD